MKGWPRIAIVLLIVGCFAITAALLTSPQHAARKRIDTVMAAGAAGKWQPPAASDASATPLPTAQRQSLTPEQLRTVAAPLVALGPPGVASLFRWVEKAPTPGVRYVAIYSLEQLTKTTSEVPESLPPLQPPELKKLVTAWKKKLGNGPFQE